MPNVMNDWAAELNDGKPIVGYYVYGWVCADWGGIYFYVGKGQGGRYKQTTKRGKSFKAIIEHWNCFPVILADGLTEEEAWEWEDKIKTDFIFKHGYPIMDGEGNSSTLKNRAIKLARLEKRKTDPNYREGRKPIPYDVKLFSELYAMQKRGEITVIDAAEKLGVSRTKWYRIVKQKQDRPNPSKLESGLA